MEGRVLRSGKEYEYFTELGPVGDWRWGWPQREYSWLLQCYITHTQTDGHTHHKWTLVYKLKTYTGGHTHGYTVHDSRKHTHTHTGSNEHINTKWHKLTQTTEKMNGHTHMLTGLFLTHMHTLVAVVHPRLHSSILFLSYARCQLVWDNNVLNTHINTLTRAV